MSNAHFVIVHYSGKMLTMDFGDGDRRQLDADRVHWRTRLRDLEKEVESEPARIRASYDVRARRVEPVGVVYLWPTSR